MESKKMVPPTKPHFFKPFLPGSERQLPIPAAFFRHLEGQYCDNVLLRGANEKLWHVKVNGRKLQDGWEEFVSEHCLRVGNFLVFRHEGDMLFDVMVFDNSTCERDYASTTLSQVDIEVYNDTLKHEDTEDMYAGASVKKTKVITTIQGKAKPSLLKNPYFEVTVLSSSIIRSKMRIPMAFAKQNCLLNACCEILLVNQQGRSWTAKLKYDRRYRETYIGGGWSTFRSENSLNCGDSFIFELNKKGKKHVFKMHGLRKAIKEPNPTRMTLPTCDIKSAFSSIRNPYFTAPINISSGKKYQLMIPKQFAITNGLFRKRCNMVLEDERGKPWPLSLRPCADCVQIGNGWWNFVKAKGLETGDRVILELVKNRGKPLMKFHGIIEVKLESTADA